MELAVSRPPQRAAAAQTVLDSLPFLVIAVDTKGVIRTANIPAAEALSASTGGLVGRRIADVFGLHSVVASLARQSAAEGVRLTEADVSLEGPTFALGRVDLFAAPLDDGTGAVLTFMPKLVERSDRKPKGPTPIARTLAHEVRNPLAGIRAAAQLIGRTADPASLALTQLICAETDRIRRLTDRLDALDELAPPNVSRVNIHEALDRARSVVAMSFPEVATEVAYDPSLPCVSGDIDQLIQVFLNLAKNAAEALRDQSDGKVHFSTRFRPGLRVRTGGGKPRSQLEACIRDNGPGLPPELSGRLFEPFATGKPGGVGLGLAVAAEIITRHQGRIEVDSRPGDTAFRVLLPIPDSQETP